MQSSSIAVTVDALARRRARATSLDLWEVTEESAAGPKEITVVSGVPKGLSIKVDLNMLRIVLRNLVSNAIKFTHPRGTVDIGATRTASEVTVTVKDTGIGIPGERMSQMFLMDKGYQSRGTAGEKGTGLGLRLCKDFVEAMGGRIWIESVEGSGTIVSFTIRDS
ncbi:MAG: ATP-binding protein [Myxococcales bacterium]